MVEEASTIPGGYRASDGRWYSADGRSEWDGTSWVSRGNAAGMPSPPHPPLTWERPGARREPRRGRRVLAGGAAVIGGLALVGIVTGDDQTRATSGAEREYAVEQAKQAAASSLASSSDLASLVAQHATRYGDDTQAATDDMIADLDSVQRSVAVIRARDGRGVAMALSTTNTRMSTLGLNLEALAQWRPQDFRTAADAWRTGSPSTSRVQSTCMTSDANTCQLRLDTFAFELMTAAYKVTKALGRDVGR